MNMITLFFVFLAGFAFGWFVLALIIIGEENEKETDGKTEHYE